MPSSSGQHSPARSAGDEEGLPGDEVQPAQPDTYHDSNTNWQEIQDVKERLSKMEAFDQEICRLPLLNKEVKDQKDRTIKVEENIGGLYQKVLDMEEYLKIIGKLEAQSLEHMEVQLRLTTVMDKLEHDNNTLKTKIKELEDQIEQSKENQGAENYHFKGKTGEKELVNTKNSEPHKWEAGQGTSQDWRSLVDDHAERTK